MSEINSSPENKSSEKNIPSHFIRQIISDDNLSGKWEKRVHTRFPPEPNGYLHIGHAKSICLNFGMAAENNGLCNLRFDDSNPAKEDIEYVESIEEDVRWLGFDWDNRMYYASDYFDQLYEYAEQLVRMGKAYVCELSSEEVRKYRGSLTQSGINSPYRCRTIEENLDLFRRMKAGEFPDGSKTLRAKIDMTSPNINMRDPAIYRIKHVSHHQTGDKWCIYPMYDFTHCVSDSIERITHSICTLEFEDHRPLYDWFLDELNAYHPQQIEFARLNLTYTMMSKRKLLELVNLGIVSGWDDPRMPTICGLRRRGYTPEAIRQFAEMIGVSKKESMVDIGVLEYCIREDLNKRANRAMAVINPLKVIIENYDDSIDDELDATNNPENLEAGTRKIKFSKEIYIERDDFMENPPKKFYRLAPGREVRLRYAYFISCKDVIKDENGEITALICNYDPASRGGSSPDGRKVQGTIHWVSATHSEKIETRLYNQLFTKEDLSNIEEGKDYKDYLNPESMQLVNIYAEPMLKNAKAGDRFQFERLGYFCVDSKDSSENKPVYNRIVGLRDSWAKIQRKAE
ncbi:MAG: glutamine--tRNA ligase/YqeY domain fusion protein [Candidatus Kapabacteria bacterium]|nr:glutamine--tRNA ligase/YqeY domain fusion protein [Candidatus Kapabacteria bacterium]